MSPGPSGALWKFPVGIGHSWKRSGPGSVTDLLPRTPWALPLCLEWMPQLLAHPHACPCDRDGSGLLIPLALYETGQKESVFHGSVGSICGMLATSRAQSQALGTFI